MLRSLLAAILLIATTAAIHANQGYRQIGWEDLIPKSDPIPNPLVGLEIDLLDSIGYIARTKDDLAQGFIEEDSEEYQFALKLEKELEAEGLVMDEVMQTLVELDAEIARRGKELVEGWEGEVVRIPGYALPLEFTTDGVKQFFLVPYVGACIHVPPPPMNQMVLVNVEEAYTVKSLYDPIWVTGTIKAQPSTRMLFFIDGEAPIETGYVLSGISIEPYE